MDGTDRARRAHFERVAAEVFEPLQRYLRRRARSDHAADVFSDTLFVVWRRLDDVPADDPLPWCYGVARHCLSNHRRGAQRHLRLVDKVRSLPFSAASAADTGMSEPDVTAALACLSDSEAEIVRLWAWEQLEPREISVVLDLSPNAVSVALARAKRKLRVELDDRQDPPAAGQESVGRSDTHRNDGSER